MALPKANLHLHLTGAMRPSTLASLALRAGIPVPAPLPAGVHGWEVFQDRYDAARRVLRTADDLSRVATEAIEDDEADGGVWTEIQVDPTSYAPLLGSPEAVVEALLPAFQGRGGLILASSWAASPSVAESTARLAVRYADQGVVGFGLSNDERRGTVADFGPACRLAAKAGLLVTPHAGFYTGAWHVRECVLLLGARRIGHGLSAAADPSTMELLASRGVTLEVCPTSYPPLGVCSLADLPLRALLAAGVPVALGTDDPLLFRAGLATQYDLVREHLSLTDEELSQLARHSLTASAAH